MNLPEQVKSMNLGKCVAVGVAVLVVVLLVIAKLSMLNGGLLLALALAIVLL